MKRAICTISSKDHLFKSAALLDSVAADGTDLFCLCIDGNAAGFPDMNVHSLDELQSETATKLKQKYRGDQLRWALKPVYLKHLLALGYDAVIYCDNDIFFYDSPQFLFEKLETSSFLLTPHFYDANPRENQNWLEANFRVGLYNAGFVGVSQKGGNILDWWADCCLYNVKKAFWRGLFDDQKYLDLVPVLFDGVEILKHKGCNLAGWNYKGYALSRGEKGHLLVNGERLVFIHFAALSMQDFSAETSFLKSEHEVYQTALKKYNPGVGIQKNKIGKRSIRAYFYYLRWLLVRKFEPK